MRRGKYLVAGKRETHPPSALINNTPLCDDDITYGPVAKRRKTDEPTARLNNTPLCDDIIRNYLIEYGPLDWLYVSKRCHRRAMHLLHRDDRVDFTYGYHYPLQWATAHGYDDVVDCLLRHPSVVPSILNLDTHYHDGNRYGRYTIRVIEKKSIYFWMNDLDMPVLENEALVYAINAGHLSTVERLLRHERIDPSGEFHLPFFFAMRVWEPTLRRSMLDRLLSHPRFRMPPIEDVFRCAIKYKVVDCFHAHVDLFKVELDYLLAPEVLEYIMSDVRDMDYIMSDVRDMVSFEALLTLVFHKSLMDLQNTPYQRLHTLQKLEAALNENWLVNGAGPFLILRRGLEALKDNIMALQ
jgi:hypothetical protein